MSWNGMIKIDGMFRLKPPWPLPSPRKWWCYFGWFSWAHEFLLSMLSYLQLATATSWWFGRFGSFFHSVGNGKSSQLLLTQIFQRGRVKNHQPVTGASQRTGPGESAPELSTFYLLQDDYMHIVLIIVHCLYTDMYKMYVYIYIYVLHRGYVGDHARFINPFVA
jgi:hypothetical protein